ncbi:MAG: energy-coupling factor ABC transporter ATP-binding protein [Fusicatenibacter sp.]|nr:energy-coupling factor ABC transporter ATP-binding protein [Fusicatenibacter sp.]
MSHIHIDVEKVSFGYEKGNEILKDISFHAGEGDSIGLVGANGVGKSTLLKLLVGLNPGFEGSIRVEEIPVQKDMLPKIREKIGYVFQDSDSQLFMSTAYDDIAFAPRNYGLPDAEVRVRVERALEMTGISYLRDKQIYKMSGGEKKLVSIATILSMTPDIILMDEPSIALDPRNRRNLIKILNSFEHLKIIASHDLDMILDTCDRTILMADGRIIRDGDTKEILSDQELLEKYGLELPLCMHNSVR